MNEKMVKMTSKEFADYLLNHDFEKQKFVQFALTDERLNGRQGAEYSDWWYCTLIDIPENNTLCLLFDVCGGGYPRCVPLTEGDDYFEDELRYMLTHLDAYDVFDGINVETWEEGGKRI